VGGVPFEGGNEKLMGIALLGILNKTKLDKNLPGGIYKVYIIPSLNKVPNSLNLPLYTTEYEINDLNKLRLVTEFMIEYTWSP
jgi:hypothetical protein